MCASKVSPKKIQLVLVRHNIVVMKYNFASEASQKFTISTCMTLNIQNEVWFMQTKQAK